MRGIDLGVRNYYRVQPINIASSCNNTMYPKTPTNSIGQAKKNNESETFKSILEKCIDEQKRRV